jgi:hypothetical protein
MNERERAEVVARFVSALIQGADLDEEEASELAEVIALRKHLANEAMQVAESHREAVWQNVQERLRRQTPAQGMPHLLRRFRRRSDDDTSRGPPLFASIQPAAVPAAYPRSATGQMAQSTHEMARARVWAKLTSRTASDDTPVIAAGPGWHRRSAPRFALVAAALALIAVSLGPLPVTGFAHHPAGPFFESVGRGLGTEDARPPSLAALPKPDIVAGSELGVSEASALSGLDFVQPDQVPSGFSLTSSRYYPGSPQSVRGTFVLTYASANAVISVYQGQGGAGELVAEAGSSEYLTLSNGTQAVLIDGAWTAGAEGLTWSRGAEQTLVFERRGVRVVVGLQGQAPGNGFLAGFAETLH